MNKFLVILALTTFASICKGQEIKLDWIETFGGIGRDSGIKMVFDNQGEIYTCGAFDDQVSFPSVMGNIVLNTNGNSDVFIKKEDSEGSLIWIKTIGGTSSDFAESITVDSLGFVYILGRFKDSVDFDPGPNTYFVNAEYNDAKFVLKLNQLGEFVWVKKFKSNNFDQISNIKVDLQNSVYITGTFEDSVDLNPGTGVNMFYSNGGYDSYVLKLDITGEYLWAIAFGGIQNDFGSDLIIDHEANIFSVGTFEGTVDFDPGPAVNNITSEGGSDFYIHKIDSSGNLIWVKTIGGSSYDGALSLTSDDKNNLFISGYFALSVDFDPGVAVYALQTTSIALDAFLLKLNHSGEFKWCNRIGGNNLDYSYTSCIDNNGNVTVGGIFKDSINFNSGYYHSAGEFDCYIIQFDSLGSTRWNMTYGGINDDHLFNIATDSLGAIYATGEFRETVDFDPSLSTENRTSFNSNYDFYNFKIHECLNDTTIDSQESCSPFQWIDGNTYYTSTDSVSYNYVNITGCDSIVFLDLTIYEVDTTISLINEITLQSNCLGADYQWLDCEDNYNPILGENNPIFLANYNGLFSVEVEYNNCIDTSDCISINSLNLIDKNESLNFEIYPNPSSGVIYYTNTPTKIKLYTSDGKSIQFDHLAKNKGELDLSKIPVGLYYIEFEFKNDVIIKKFIKQ